MIDPKERKEPLEEAILYALRYFALFRYPLSKDEIHAFLPLKCTVGELESTIEELLDKHEIHALSGEWYSISNTPEWVEERKHGYKQALEVLNRVAKYVNTIRRFPFVRGIAISGSLAKYYATQDYDIDYFIITRSNRLWIARTLLHAFKKLTFLRSQQHYYCMNYFVDEEALEIKHKNVYTAIELATLIPVYNKPGIERLLEKNTWMREYIPNHALQQDDRFVVLNNPSVFKGFVESFLNVFFPRRLNRSLMRLTDAKWRKKWKKAAYPMEDYDQAFLTTEHVSKNHPTNYQKQVLSSLKNKTTQLSS